MDSGLFWTRVVTDNGYIRGTHVEKGEYLYGVDLSVARCAPASVATALLVATADLTVRKGLRGNLLGGRLPSYHKVAARMSAYDYIFGKRPSGRPRDAEISMYAKYGLRAIKAIPDYFHDPDSLDWGILLFWANPFRAETSAEAELSLAPMVDLYVKTDRKYDHVLGEVTCLHLELPGTGCSWARLAGGCSMCSFSDGARAYSHGQLLKPILFESMYRVARESARKRHPKILSVFNGGSFLNPEEIPPEFQTSLASVVGDDPDIQALYVETRAEYVTSGHLRRMVSLLQAKRIVLGIGLESISDHVRNHIIRKGLPLEVYQQAIATAHEMRAAVRTYVLLKPHGLTESDAVEDAIETVRAAFAMGSDEVSLEASFVAPNTILQTLFEEGTYQPPSLWSIAQVLIATASLGPVYLGKFTDTPPPIAVPSSCPSCSPRVTRVLDEYRNSLSLAALGALPHCECQRRLNT